MAEAEAEFLRPLDEEFVDRLIAVTGATNLDVYPRRENHFWRDQLRALREHDHTYSEIAEIIAERFRSGAWTDQTAPTTSELIRDVFDGYDRTRSITAEEHVREEPGFDQREPTTPPPPSASASATTAQAPFNTPRPRHGPGTSLPTPGSTRGEGRRGHTTQTNLPPRTPPNRTTGVLPPGTETIPSAPAERSLPTPLPSAVRRNMRPRSQDVPDVVPQFLPPEDPASSSRTVSEEAPTEADNNQDDDDGSVPPPPRVDTQDLEGTHVFEGQRQPAIGVRLQQALIWATDEDVDRRQFFTREKEELERWLRYVDREHAHTLGPHTLRAMAEVRRKLRAHDLFARQHQATMKTKISDPQDMKTRTPRLGGDNNPQGGGPPLQLGSFSTEERNARLLPVEFESYPRAWKRVNTMWDTPREAALPMDPKLNDVRADRIRALAQHEDAYWQTRPGTDPPANNLSVMENKAYEDCKAFNHGLSGGVYWDQPTTTTAGPEIRRLWNGATPGNGEGCFANERGARRAGLETALRQFRNTENRLFAAQSAAALVALPPTAEELAAEQRKAGVNRGRLLDIRGLEPARMGDTQGKKDPQGFMANMAQFWRKHQQVEERAREDLLGSHTENRLQESSSSSSTIVKPPPSLWGPHVWRGVSLDTEHKQDLLRQARAVKAAFDRERKIAPRPLLENMNHFFVQGYSTHAEEPLYPQTTNTDGGQQQRRLRTTGPRNRHPVSDNLRRVDMLELEWLRLILNNAMADARVLKDVQPRTALFLAFAERLERIFQDLASPLFPEQDTSVDIDTLIAYMAGMDGGPVTRPTFYPYDVKYWLERLDEQGRCRYRDDWRTHGWVQRPVYRYFPEQLIIWKDRRGDDEIDVEAFPEDAIYAPRLTQDLRPWAEVVRPVPPQPLNPTVETWFHQLAFRWGRTMRHLEALETRVWQDDASLLSRAHLATARHRLQRHYDALAADQQLDWATLVRRTLDHPDDSVAAAALSDDGVALQTIRDGIIDECVRADSMLWPGRAVDYLDTSASAVRTRESIWDWARPEIRGPVKKFFSLDRWPVEIQPEALRRRMESSEDIDPQQVWNPITEDPTPWTYHRQKARPYRDEPVRHKEGRRKYLIGDTARQEEVIKNTIVARVATGMGLLDVDGSPLAQASSASGGVGAWSRMRGLFKRKRQNPEHNNGDDDDDNNHDEGLPLSKLPRIDAALIPKSVDREQLEAEELASAQLRDEARRAADVQPPRNRAARNPNLRVHVAAPTDHDVVDDMEEDVQ